MLLAIVWFLLVGVLFTGYIILDGFDLGVGILSLFNRKDDERRLYINSIAPVWDGNEVWLITGGGALFAAFPPVYATMFEGFYIALMLVLASLIFRAVSMEFRNKVDSPVWRHIWDKVFGISSLVAALLFGVAAGNILRGVPINDTFMFKGTFLGLLNPYSLLVGIATLFLVTTLGALYLTLKTEGELRQSMKNWALRSLYVFLVLFIIGFLWTLMLPVWRENTIAWKDTFKLQIVFPILIVLVVINLFRLLKAERFTGAFFHACIMTICVMSFILVSLYPRLIPSNIDLANSLTIHNASSSQLTLKVMLIIALTGMPLVIVYQAFIYYIFKGHVVIDEDSY